VVDLLIKLHFGQSFWLNCIVSPADIPIHRICSLLAFPAEALGDLANNRVLTIYMTATIPEMFITILLAFF
jgi:hypothetical protein